MKNSRLLGAIAAGLLANAANAEIITYHLDSENVWGWYTFERDDVFTRTSLYSLDHTLTTTEERSIDYIEVIDFNFEVDIPSVGHSEVFNPETMGINSFYFDNIIDWRDADWKIGIRDDTGTNVLAVYLRQLNIETPPNNPFTPAEPYYLTDVAGLPNYDWDINYFRINGVDAFDYIDDSGKVANLSAVPIPAAVWLFGSGLLGLIGIARRKKSA